LLGRRYRLCPIGLDDVKSIGLDDAV
jgi:hypothetical protein